MKRKGRVQEIFKMQIHQIHGVWAKQRRTYLATEQVDTDALRLGAQKEKQVYNMLNISSALDVLSLKSPRELDG